MEEYEIKNGLDYIEFEGEVLGQASSRKSQDKDQWTVITIYRTRGGKYVVQKEGRSVRYHRRDGECQNDSWEQIKGSDITDEDMPCPRCDPAVPEDGPEFVEDEIFLHETNWSNADVVDTPPEVRESLLMPGKDGKQFLSAPSYSAIQDAIRRDPSLRTMFERRRRIE